MVEISTPQGPFAIPHVLRDADIREVPELTAELHRVKREPSASSSGRWLERAGPAVTRIPGTVQAMYAVMARSVTARQRIGTVAVTAVGMFAGGGGFGITSLTLMSLEVIVGGMTQRPRIVDGQAAIRDVLDLTVAIDHNVVDGAPAARFAAEFRELLESAAVITPSSVALQAPEIWTCPLFRRSMEGVRSVRRNPYRQVSILLGVRRRRRSPVPSGQSVRKL